MLINKLSSGASITLDFSWQILKDLLSIVRMKITLPQEDIKSFSVWVFITCFFAGLPFMVM